MKTQIKTIYTITRKYGATGTSVSKNKLQKECKYGHSYLQFRFTCGGDSSVPDAQCVLSPNFRNGSMVSAKLQWHLHTKHFD
jgi:hypothetical protein